MESSVFTFFSVTLLLILASKKHQCEARKTGLTTLNLEDQFKEKCKIFGTIKRSSEIYKTTLFNDDGCDDLWTRFIAVIDKKDENTVQQGYADYFKYVEKTYYKTGFKDAYFNGKV